MTALSLPVRRFLAVALVLLALLSLGILVLAPLAERAQLAAEQLADSRFRLERFRVLAESSDEQEAARSGRPPIEPWLLAGETSGSALALLQEQARNMAEAQGLTVELIEARPLIQTGPATVVSVDIVARGPERAVLTVLHQWEAGAVPLVVRRVRITAAHQAGMPSTIEAQLHGIWARPPEVR